MNIAQMTTTLHCVNPPRIRLWIAAFAVPSLTGRTVASENHVERDEVWKCHVSTKSVRNLY